MAKRINRVIELIEAGEPVYYFCSTSFVLSYPVWKSVHNK